MSSVKSLLEHGLMEALAQALMNAAHISISTFLIRDIHILLVLIATRLLESPGSQNMHAIVDMHVILNLIELKERSWCGSDKSCVMIARSAQVALFDGELDVLTPKISSHIGFHLKNTASYLASTSYLTNGN